MVCTIHYECHARCYLTELSDNQPVADEIIMMQYMLLKVSIAEIREVTDYYVRILYGRLTYVTVSQPLTGKIVSGFGCMIYYL